jgi:hypothetical protein
VSQPSNGLPVPLAAAVRQLAGKLREVLRDGMGREQPAPEVALLWQAATLINRAADGLDGGASVHPGQWVDLAGVASDIADAALQIAATGLSPAQAAAQQEEIDQGPYWGNACAYAATVQMSRPDVEGTGRTVTVDIAGDPGRALTVATEHGTEPRPHTPVSLLRVAHHLHRLGATLGEVVDGPAR